MKLSIDHYFHIVAQFFRLHMASIAVGIVAVILTIYGSHINRFFRKSTKGMHFWVRYSLFILLCTAGYGFLSSQLVKILRDVLRQSPDRVLVGAVIGSFLVLAFLARAGKEV